MSKKCLMVSVDPRCMLLVVWGRTFSAILVICSLNASAISFSFVTIVPDRLIGAIWLLVEFFCT